MSGFKQVGFGLMPGLLLEVSRIAQNSSSCPCTVFFSKKNRVSVAAAATGGYVEFDRPFTHLCVFPFSGRGNQSERERERK